MRPEVPPAVAEMARSRAAARAAEDWAEADRLRDLISAAGWIAVDRGTHYALRPLHPPDLADGAVVRHGRSDTVPSRLGEDPTVAVTVVAVIESDATWPNGIEDLERRAAVTTQVVLVANAPEPDAEAALMALAGATALGERASGAEIVWTSDRLALGAARNAGIRRAVGAVVVLIGSGGPVSGDLIGSLRAALVDPAIAIAGTRGLFTADLHRFSAGDAGEPAAVEETTAFRRAEYIARGPLDERYRTAHGLDAWWSLTLRDSGEGIAPRRAVVLRDRTMTGAEDGRSSEPGPDRALRRDRYRLLEAFAGRVDLISEAASSGPGRAT